MDTADIVLINQLLAHYGHIVDAEEWARFDELFVDDAELDYRGVNVPEVLRGLEAIKSFFRGANHPSAHYCTNVYVYRDDNGLTRVKSKFVAPYTRAPASTTSVVRRRLRRRRSPLGSRLAISVPYVYRPVAVHDRPGPVPEHRRTW